jgi:abhydrolase domain-containing protein 6
MKKKRLKKVSIGLALTVYTITLAFWVVSGVKTASVLANNDHVITMYANTIDLGDDRTMFYREVGEEHEETILFIHGFLGSSYDFVHVMDALKDRYHVIAVDLIGFGLSSKPLSYDYGKANQAETVYNFIQEKNVSNLTVMAHSMGGEVTIHLVSSYPAFFKNLILIGSAGYLEERSSSTPPTLPLFVYKEIVQNYFIQRAFFLTAYSEFERQNKLITFEDFDEMYIVNRTIPPEILRKFSADNDTMNMTNKINTITIPVLLMWGEFDGFIPLSVGEKLQESFGENATLLVMPNAGHLPFDTFFDDFMRYVEEFMA